MIGSKVKISREYKMISFNREDERGREIGRSSSSELDFYVVACFIRFFPLGF